MKHHFVCCYERSQEAFTAHNLFKVVWETLRNIEGDSQFVDQDFKLVSSTQQVAEQNVCPGQQMEQE